ncbi:unnamed protein product [Strongylus vulgaris]|uniref:glucuronosyltransferase n=1 Tax=Strongylus vulgaris TaxID=40348 RepID=A0A3P7JGD3_STRVU|nr:unnamed protein product [Strongylus vulgaris]
MDFLADDRLTLFITHGGAGSLLESATSGKPLIVVPLFGDQMRNAKLVEKFGFGITLSKESLANTVLMRDAIQKIFEDKKYTKAAQRIRDLLAKRPFTPEEKLVKTVELAAEFGHIPESYVAGRNLNVIVYYNLDIYFLFIVVCLLVVFALLCGLRKLLKLLTVKPNSEKIKDQ